MILERTLNSIGKQCFVKYYNDFKNCENKDELASRLLNENPSASSIQAQVTRVNSALRIFESKLEKEALVLIVSSKRVDRETALEAKKLLDSM